MDPMASLIMNDVHDDLKDTAFTYWAYENQRQSQKRAADLQMGLNTQMANLARMNRQGAAYDEVQGLIKAGLSPVLAGGGSFSPAGSSGSGPVAPAAPPSISHSQMGKLAQEQRELEFQQKQWNQAQLDLAKSQSEKNRADAKAAEASAGASEAAASESTSRTAMNEYAMNFMHSRDESIAASARKFAEAVKNKPDASEMDKAIASAFADCSNPDAGTVEGIEKFLDNVKKHYENAADVATANLRGAIASDQIKDPAVREALSRMPEADFNHLTAAAGELVTQMYLNESKKDLTDADIKKTRQLIVNYSKEAEKLSAETEKIKAERKAIVHGDIIQSMEEDPAATLLRETYTLGKQAGQAYIGGKGLGKFGQTLGREPVTTKPQPIDIKFDEKWRYNKNGQPTSHTRSEMRRLSE